MSDLLNIPAKHIDESRQGEAFQPVGIHISGGRKFYIESYGCAMNFSDSEIIASILQSDGFTASANADIADLILLNTCAIRDNAEQRVRQRLADFKKIKKNKPGVLIGMLGCMAEG